VAHAAERLEQLVDDRARGIAGEPRDEADAAGISLAEERVEGVEDGQCGPFGREVVPPGKSLAGEGRVTRPYRTNRLEQRNLSE